MLVEKLLISDADVKKYSAMGGSTQIEKYRMDLIWIQEFQILPLLGKKLYLKIEQDFENEELAGDYELIWKYCRNILARFIAYEHGKIANYNLKNAGVYKVDNNGRQTVEKKEVDFLAQDQKIKGLDYLEKLRILLCDKRENLKEFDLSGCGCACNQNASRSGKYQMDWLL